jgi:putative peptidoglycan lipid II flippase
MYALGLPFYGLYKILVPTFYALDQQKVPVLASIFSIAFNISFCLILTPVYGFQILALGTTLSVFVNACILAWVLKKSLSLSTGFFLNPRMGKVVLASGGAALVLETLIKVELFSQTFVVKCFLIGAQISSVILLYAGVLILLGERSAVNALVAKFAKKFKRK